MDRNLETTMKYHKAPSRIRTLNNYPIYAMGTIIIGRVYFGNYTCNSRLDDSTTTRTRGFSKTSLILYSKNLYRYSIWECTEYQ